MEPVDAINRFCVHENTPSADSHNSVILSQCDCGPKIFPLLKPKVCKSGGDGIGNDHHCRFG